VLDKQRGYYLSPALHSQPRNYLHVLLIYLFFCWFNHPFTHKLCLYQPTNLYIETIRSYQKILKIVLYYEYVLQYVILHQTTQPPGLWPNPQYKLFFCVCASLSSLSWPTGSDHSHQPPPLKSPLWQWPTAHQQCLCYAVSFTRYWKFSSAHYTLVSSQQRESDGMAQEALSKQTSKFIR